MNSADMDILAHKGKAYIMNAIECKAYIMNVIECNSYTLIFDPPAMNPIFSHFLVRGRGS